MLPRRANNFLALNIGGSKANSEGNHGEDVKQYYFYLDSKHRYQSRKGQSTQQREDLQD